MDVGSYDRLGMGGVSCEAARNPRRFVHTKKNQALLSHPKSMNRTAGRWNEKGCYFSAYLSIFSLSINIFPTPHPHPNPNTLSLSLPFFTSPSSPLLPTRTHQDSCTFFPALLFPRSLPMHPQPRPPRDRAASAFFSMRDCCRPDVRAGEAACSRERRSGRPQPPRPLAAPSAVAALRQARPRLASGTPPLTCVRSSSLSRCDSRGLKQF